MHYMYSSVLCMHEVPPWLYNLQNHQSEGEAGIKAAFAKLHEEMQEGFRKLEE